jgi:leader peptidase (prepilin peptidase)/N-methyltransferase
MEPASLVGLGMLSAPMPLVVGLTFLLGAMVGSFLNVVVHRLPRMLERQWQEECAHARGEELPEQAAFNIAVPRSACPHCGHLIPWHENIPLLSYVWLKGRCSQCAAGISPRYPLVELLTACLSAYSVWHFGANWSAVAALVLVWCLLALTFIDMETQLLPDVITLPLLWLGLLWNLMIGFTPLDQAVIGAVSGYLVLWIIYHVFKLITGKEGMGYGDFKLLAALGAWLGWSLLPLVILASSVVGAVIGIGMIVLVGHDRAKPLPFGPYLALGGIIALYWGEALVRTYLQP